MVPMIIPIDGAFDNTNRWYLPGGTSRLPMDKPMDGTYDNTIDGTY